ncbi:MAG: EF2563 family selenium-dependent molybdenum hydroxylase system protein [Synergistaceae bacterium]|jgi:xanthine dehydrogenase accessory factor|nr:EF2563 family selenium-dependent molybdenum hydroxylase system protein [Synergistaceae bacterium]
MTANQMTAVLRGGGDLATGVAQKLWRAGFTLVILELPYPTTVRRSVALSSAMTEGVALVEDLTARRISDPSECLALWGKGEIPVLADPLCDTLSYLRPIFLVDATVAKRNLGTSRDMAPVTVALGPGFTAPTDVDVVVETMRGHDLGRLITEGEALPNTGAPGEIGGKTTERVVFAPQDGVITHRHKIGDLVSQGETIFFIDDTPIPSPIDGTLRGLIAKMAQVSKGLKCADVDPRPGARANCFSISDKARCLGGSVLEACLYLGRQKGIL